MFERFRTRRRQAGADQASSDALYAGGGWDKLRDQAELGRYAMIAGYCAHLRVRSVLDVGCGEGVLAESMSSAALEDYVGVDFSPVAIATAEAKGIANARFIVGEAQTYTPDRRFDAIVFNEVLYYLDDPGRAVSRLTEWLEPDGCIVVSIFRNETDWVWRKIEPLFERADSVTIAHGSGLTWDVRLLRRKRGASS
jgi:2-polyprenyl-3-methyl-5-hydroxy-6-metoxy-1,4-benzoquinol methylase